LQAWLCFVGYLPRLGGPAESAVFFSSAPGSRNEAKRISSVPFDPPLFAVSRHPVSLSPNPFRKSRGREAAGDSFFFSSSSPSPLPPRSFDARVRMKVPPKRERRTLLAVPFSTSPFNAGRTMKRSIFRGGGCVNFSMVLRLRAALTAPSCGRRFAVPSVSRGSGSLPPRFTSDPKRQDTKASRFLSVTSLSTAARMRLISPSLAPLFHSFFFEGPCLPPVSSDAEYSSAFSFSSCSRKAFPSPLSATDQGLRKGHGVFPPPLPLFPKEASCVRCLSVRAYPPVPRSAPSGENATKISNARPFPFSAYRSDL